MCLSIVIISSGVKLVFRCFVIAVNPSYPRRYVARASGVQAQAAYIIQTTNNMQLYDCLAQCYTVGQVIVRFELPRSQVPTCESAVYTSTAGTCVLTYARYEDNLGYMPAADPNWLWLEPIYY